MKHAFTQGRLIHGVAPRQATKLISKLTAAIICCVLFVNYAEAQANAKGKTQYPSCNISGPLETVAAGPDVVVTIEVARSTNSPDFLYTFNDNSSGAVIKKRGPITYNAGTNTATQQVTIAPGNGGTGFNLRLKVHTAAGDSECSKSVTVSR